MSFLFHRQVLTSTVTSSRLSRGNSFEDKFYFHFGNLRVMKCLRCKGDLTPLSFDEGNQHR